MNSSAARRSSRCSAALLSEGLQRPPAGRVRHRRARHRQERAGQHLPVVVGRTGRARRSAHAQCIELYGTSEPYLPIFEAMQRLGAEIGVDKLAIYLKSFAPTWLAQMPWLSDGAQPPADAAGATPQRMLRELAQALEAMSAARPVVLWLEDLHWSDRSTLDAISFLARRSESGAPDGDRLLPPGRGARARPSRAGGQGSHRPPRRRAPSWRWASSAWRRRGSTCSAASRSRPAELGELSQFIHGRTDGNPLFVVALADDLVRNVDAAASDGAWRLTGPISRDRSRPSPRRSRS